MSGIVARVKQAILIAAFGLSAGAFGIAPVQAQISYTYGVGGPGGALFDDPCRNGDVLVGFNYTYGKAMDSIGPVCQQLDAAGHIVGSDYGLRTWGGNGQGGAFRGRAAYRCPPDQAVTGLHVWFDGNGIVHHVRALCHVVVGNVIGTYLGMTKNTGGVAVGHGGGNCPPGAFAIGMTGYYGELVDKLGLKCNTFQVADTAPVNTAPPADNTTPPPVETTPPPNNPPPDASTRTAATATTIYDQPEGNDVAYLDAGDTVTIVSCEDDGQGWCRISKPKKGYVWGADLN